MFTKITLGLFVGVLFLGCLATISVFGQSAYTYADTWVDSQADYTQTDGNGEVYIVGAGVAEIDTSALPHSANMQVEVVSPQGRAEYGLGTWSQQSSGTSITVVVPLSFLWDDADTGNYFTNTTVQVTCPLEPGASYGSASLPVSIKREIYKFLSSFPTGGRFGYGFCQYDNYCPFGQGICGLSEFTVDRHTANATCPNDLQCRTLYVRGACYNRAKVCTSLTGQGVCDYN
jgi:hypothetical protein